MMTEEDRRALVASFGAGGMDPVRARLIVDLADTALVKALAAFNAAVDLAPDKRAALAIEDIGLQLVGAYADARLAQLHALAGTHGLPSNGVEISFGG